MLAAEFARGTPAQNGAGGPVVPGVMCAQPRVTQDNRVFGVVNKKECLLLRML